MNAPITMPVTAQWPPEVLEFAAEKEVLPYLEPVLEVTRKAFPTANQITAKVEEDHEIRDLRYIVLEVKLPRIVVDEAVASEWQWCRGLLACCPAPLAGAFVLGIDLDRP